MTALTPKDLVRRALSLKPVPRTPFLPLVCSMAARLEQISLREMLTSPELLARSIWNTQKLFGYDGVIIVLDPTLEAEACGCPLEWQEEGPVVVGHPLAEPRMARELDIAQIATRGRLPVVLEATKRVSLTAGRTVAVAAAITGPLTLAQHLSGRAIAADQEGALEGMNDLLDVAGKVMVQMARLYCELKVDVIFVADELLGRLESSLVHMLERYFRPVWNVVSYYSAFSMIHAACRTPELYRALQQLGADAVVGTPSALTEGSAGERMCTGLAAPLALFFGDKPGISEQVRALLQDRAGASLIVTTEWEVPPEVPPEKMHYLVEALRQSAEA